MTTEQSNSNEPLFVTFLRAVVAKVTHESDDYTPSGRLPTMLVLGELRAIVAAFDERDQLKQRVAELDELMPGTRHQACGPDDSEEVCECAGRCRR
jgi:hypothetical protein